MVPPDLLRRADALLAAARDRGLTLATAESCTGGLVAALLTEIAGSSASFAGGLVTYSNAMKVAMLGVSETVLAAHGAVSAECATAMASGALARTGADIAVSITGIAGPGGGTAAKPVGLVHFAAARGDGAIEHVERRFGDLGRDAIRLAAVEQAMDLLDRAVSAPGAA